MYDEGYPLGKAKDVERERIADRLCMVAVQVDTLLAKGLELFASDRSLVQAELGIQERDRRRDDAIPEKAGERTDGSLAIIDIVAVDLLCFDDRRGKFVIEFILIVYHLAVIHEQPPLCKFRRHDAS